MVAELLPILGTGCWASLESRVSRPSAPTAQQNRQSISMGQVLVAMVGPPRRATLALGKAIERVDRMLRHWSAAGLALLVLAILFDAAMLAAD